MNLVSGAVRRRQTGKLKAPFATSVPCVIAAKHVAALQALARLHARQIWRWTLGVITHNDLPV